MKIISEVFDLLRLRLLDAAHSLMWFSSRGIRCEFTEGTNKYVSSAYLNMIFKELIGWRSEALIIYSTGPMPDP